MKGIIRFTFLGFYFNSLIDEGEVLDIKETKDKINDKSLFPWLKEKYGDRLDISLYDDIAIRELEEFFEELAYGMDEYKKMGVENNGLCLLVGYCLEGVQREKHSK